MDRPRRKRIKGNSRSFSWEERKWKNRLKAEFEKIHQSGTIVLSPERSAQLLKKLHNRIKPVSQSEPRTIHMMARWVSAAMLLLVAGVLWHHYNTGSKQHHDVVASVPGVKKDTMIVHSNNSDSICHLVLSDKSVISLFQGSSVSYYASFITGKRDISLSGKAVFDVAKDMARPFTVYAGNISTTVLGTRFMMSTLKRNKVCVKLFEGKVLIHSTEGVFGMKDIYLHAGEEFVIDRQLKKFNVTSFKDSTEMPGNKEVIVNADKNNLTLEFSQEPLGKVLSTIGRRYKVQFKFKDDSFNTILVTGRLLPSDSLPVILSMLGNINGISFKKHNNSIEVARIK